MVITEAQRSQRHIPPADSANPTHSSRVDALMRKACMSERIRIRPFIESSLFSWCPAKMQVVFGFLDAMHHIFVKGSREIQALETECEIWHDPETLPQQEQQRGYISHCLLAWYSLFSQGSSTGWYLPVRKGEYLLLVSFGTGSSIAAPSGFFWETDPCNGEIKPQPLSSARFRQSLATSTGMRAWNHEFIWAWASVCKVSICPQTNGKRKSRAPRQLLVKLTNSSQTACGVSQAQEKGTQAAGNAGWGAQSWFCQAMAVPPPQQSKASSDGVLVKSLHLTQHLSCISILIPGSDTWWSRFDHRGFLQGWPRLPIPVPRQGADRRGLPQLQSEVPVWQIWYVPHLWKPGQRTAEILSSHDWLLLGVRTTSVIFPS